jgi:hypothetical protein
MEYRGVEYMVVQTIPNGWRWSVKRDRNDKVGTAFDRRGAIRLAQKFIDELLKLQSRPGE